MASSLRRLLGTAALAAALVASVVSGTPENENLPVVALGWPLLLHAERAAALTALLGLVGLVLWRAGRGELPVRFGNIEYALEDATSETRRLIGNQERRIINLEDALGVRRSDLVSGRSEAYRDLDE